jgi:RNA polymerase sigma-70 factor (ECF subfamily)
MMGHLTPVAESIRDRTEKLYRTDGARLWRAIFGYAGDGAIADDAVSEAFAQLLRRGSAVHDAPAWLWRTAFNIARGELQQRGRQTPLLDDRLSLDPETPWALVQALGVLSHQQRAVVILRDYVGHSTRETAEILGSSDQAVRAQLSRGRRNLRKELGP